jgi:putative transposase
MRAAGIVGCHRRRTPRTTRREPPAIPASDHVERQFTASAPNQVWTADITSVPTWAGFPDLGVVLDVCSRRIVGWAMADHLRTEVVVAAVDMALWNRRPVQGVIHHSDQGAHYTSVAVGHHGQTAVVVPAMGSRRVWYDPAITASFVATLACELLQRHTRRTHAEAWTTLVDSIEGCSNRQRRHSARAYHTPLRGRCASSPAGVRRMMSSVTAHQCRKEVCSITSAELSA